LPPEPADPWKVVWSNLATSVNVTLSNVAALAKVVWSNLATSVNVTLSNLAALANVALLTHAAPVNVASANLAMPVNVPPNKVALAKATLSVRRHSG
jgi:hypothetical protein